MSIWSYGFHRKPLLHSVRNSNTLHTSLGRLLLGQSADEPISAPNIFYPLMRPPWRTSIMQLCQSPGTSIGFHGPSVLALPEVFDDGISEWAA
jgi:hypothetical protein